MNDRLDIVDADEDVFGFEIGVDDSTLGVQVVQTEQDLFGDLLDDMLWDTSMLIALDQTEQVLAQDFKDHTDVVPIRPRVFKVVDEADNVMATCVMQ